MKKRKYINGAKGAISLFLALLLTPFMTIAMLLVDAGRYNSSVSILDESMNNSSNSVLANYDDYLHQRFGLLAVDQGVDVNEKYNDYLNTNAGVLENQLSINSASAEGSYSLDDPELLYSQIMEYSKFNSPTTLAEHAMKLSDIIKSLEKIGNLKNIFNLITASEGTIDSTITLKKSADKLKGYADKLDSLAIEYKENYKAFKQSFTDLKNNYKDNNSVSVQADLLYKVNVARDNYKDTVSDIIDNLKNYKQKMSECSSSLESIKSSAISAVSSAATLEANKRSTTEKLNDVKQKIKNGETTDADGSDLEEKETQLSNEIANYQTTASLLQAEQNAYDTVSGDWQENLSNYNDETIGTTIDKFNEIKSKLVGFSALQATEDSEEISDNVYNGAEVSGYVRSDDIGKYLISQEDEFKDGKTSEFFKEITSFFNSMVKLCGPFNPALSGVIDTQYYQDQFGGLPGDRNNNEEGSVIGIIKSAGTFIGSISNFCDNLPGMDLIGILENIKNLITSAKTLLTNIANFGVTLITNLKDIFTSYDKTYYSMYTAYTLPCRTDCSDKGVSFKNMTGYSLTNLPKTNIVSNNLLPFDDLQALIQSFTQVQNNSGKDLTFSGAELEYVLFGSKSEVANQLYVFFCIYFLRFALDAPAIFMNEEVGSMAAAANFGAVIVYLIELLAEPMIDCILLVNGVEGVPLVKKTIFLTASGIPSLITKLFSVCKLTDSNKKSLTKDLNKSFNIPEDTTYTSATDNILDKLLTFNYRQYCFFLLMLTVGKETQMNRLSNIIQMESLYYYKSKNVNYLFNLKNTYTYLHTEVNVNVNQLMPSLSSSSLFKITREQVRGY